MQIRNAVILLFFGSLVCQGTLAQTVSRDTTIQLTEVMVTAPRFIVDKPGYKSTTFDTTTLLVYQQRNLSDLLADESPLFIKSYGLGSLATSAFRGGSAYHTAVLWNGINISSPMNGQLDFSLVPVGGFGEIRIEHGGSSTLFGSGAVAGSIYLNNNPRFGKGISSRLDLSAGSFSDFRQNATIEFSRERWVSSLQVFNATAVNDFTFQNTFREGEQAVRQSHANFKNRGLISENSLKIGRSHQVSLHAWLQTTDRNLPPTMLQTLSRASKSDDALRLVGEWNYQKKNVITTVRSAWMNETLIFRDELSSLYAPSRTQQLVNEAESKIYLNARHSIHTGVHHTYAIASNPSFDQNPSQARLAAFASHHYVSKNQAFKTHLSARKEWVNQIVVPFTYSAGAEYRLLEGITARANFSRVYRIPTLNDLFWVPGGNPDLKPEDGYAQEAGIKIDRKYKYLRFQSDLTAFNRDIQNWIVWLPGTSFWSPQNLMNVWSRGVETNSSLILSSGKTFVQISLLTNYVLSTNELSKTENDRSVGKQLIYTPMYSGMGKITIGYRAVSLTYRHNYTGYRYTSTDHSQYLMPFDLGSIQASVRMPTTKFRWSAFFQVNNLWNEQYQIMSTRAMPGINFNAGLSFQFNHPNP